MNRILLCFLSMLLLWSCAKTGTDRTGIPPATPTASAVEITKDADQANAHPVKITQKTLEHIIARHWSASEAEGAGKFAEDITVNDLKAMIETTASQGTLRPNTNGRPGKIAEYDFRRTIGTTINGYRATRLRVVIAPNSNIITAFPY